MGRRLGDPIKLSEAARASRKRWKERNKERVKAAAAAYRLKNADANKKYYEINGERLRAKQRARPPEYSMLVNARLRARKKWLDFNITAEDIVIPKFCPYFGIELKRNSNGTILDNSPTLDRINPSLGYVKGNVEVISNKANRIKNDGTVEDHRIIYERMLRLGNTRGSK